MRTCLKAVATVRTALGSGGEHISQGAFSPEAHNPVGLALSQQVSIQMERITSGADKSYEGIKSG